MEPGGPPREAHASQLESSPPSRPQLEKSPCSSEDPARPNKQTNKCIYISERDTDHLPENRVNAQVLGVTIRWTAMVPPGCKRGWGGAGLRVLSSSSALGETAPSWAWGQCLGCGQLPPTFLRCAWGCLLLYGCREDGRVGRGAGVPERTLSQRVSRAPRGRYSRAVASCFLFEAAT